MKTRLEKQESGPAAAPRKVYTWRERLRYRGGATALRAPFVWWRHRGVRPADVIIASYPRSGNTWLRFLLFDIFTGKRSGFQEVNAAIPYVPRHAEALRLLPDGGRLISTHEVYRRDYRKAIYIVRDVRDVAVSEFLREQAKGLIGDFDEYAQEFLAGRKRHGSWADHVSSYLDARITGEGKLLVLKYEDMHEKPEETLRQVLGFLGREADSASIARALADNTVEKMRQKEDHSDVTFQGKGDDGRFVRKGAVGGWRSRLTPQQAGAIEQHAQATLLRLGYELSGGSEARLREKQVEEKAQSTGDFLPEPQIAGRSLNHG